MFGGVRFGGTITAEQAFEMGFDHVALALGAGKPTLLSIPGGLARGVRMASDFLMALQLTGAAKQDSIANLQLRLPAVVIGGGLTAIDTATEAMAYYPVQVEKFLKRYETLVAEHGAEGVRSRFNAIELEVADELHRPCQGVPRRTRARRGGRRSAEALADDRRLGRRHHRLSPAPDRFAVLHPQPRGSGEGDGGRHPLLRRPDPDAHRPGRDRPCRAHPFQERRRRGGLVPGARGAGGGGHPAQHRAGARGC